MLLEMCADGCMAFVNGIIWLIPDFSFLFFPICSYIPGKRSLDCTLAINNICASLRNKMFLLYKGMTYPTCTFSMLPYVRVILRTLARTSSLQ